jgi:hypothetical protein
MIQAYARIRVTVPGTPVRVTVNETNPALAMGCHGVLIQALPTNTGAVYIGTLQMSRSQYTGVFSVLAIPTDNQIPSFSAALTLAPAGIRLCDLYIDADQANDGVIVTVLVT